jgi:hypothetical protein
VLPDALAFSKDADAMREFSMLAVTTIPFAGNRVPHQALTCAAREGATVTFLSVTDMARHTREARTERRRGPQRPAKRPNRKSCSYNTVKSNKLKLSKEMF